MVRVQRLRPKPYHRQRLLSREELLLRGTRVNRTYGTHKKLDTYVFLLTVFGPIYYGPPYVVVFSKYISHLGQIMI